MQRKHVLAKKNGKTRQFPIRSWEALKPDQRNGWVEVGRDETKTDFVPPEVKHNDKATPKQDQEPIKMQSIEPKENATKKTIEEVLGLPKPIGEYSFTELKAIMISLCEEGEKYSVYRKTSEMIIKDITAKAWTKE